MAESSQNLWAPWRMDYIRSLDDESKDVGCFLCNYHKTPEADSKNHVILRGEHVFVVLNRFPYTNGHLMVSLARHVGDPADLTEPEQTELSRMSFQCMRLLSAAIAPQGFNLGTNIGRCAGAGLPDHLHTHVVPRWNGDTNYMAVLAGVRVIPDSLDAMYRQLVEHAVRLQLR